MAAPMYGTTKAAPKRFTPGLAQEVAEHNISSRRYPRRKWCQRQCRLSQACDGHWRSHRGNTDVDGESSFDTGEPADKINGRVTYSQQVLSEYGLLDTASTGLGVTVKGSGYS